MEDNQNLDAITEIAENEGTALEVAENNSLGVVILIGVALTAIVIGGVIYYKKKKSKYAEIELDNKEEVIDVEVDEE